MTARPTSESLAARLIRTVYLPLAGYKRTMRDADRFAATIPAQRRGGDAPPPASMLRRFGVTEREIAGSTVRFVEPEGTKARGIIVYIHGGAYVGNMQPLQWNIVAGLAERTRARVVVPCYPLAPERTWRDGYAMIGALHDELLRDVEARDLTLVGDSAGAGLALGFAQMLRDEGRPLPGRLVLISPWLDLRRDNPAQEALDASDPILARPALCWAAERWASDTPLDDSRISPLLGSLDGLPPMLVFSGTADLLNADARALARRAEEVGAPLRYVERRNMTHAWSISPIPEARSLYDEAAAFVVRS